MNTPIYTVRDPKTNEVFTGLTWTNASEQVRLYGKEWVHDFEEVLETAQAAAKANSNTEGNVRKLTREEEAAVNAPDIFAAAKAAAEAASETSSSLSDMTREELLDIAAEMKLSIDKRIGHTKLVDVIEAARFEENASVAEEVPAEDNNGEE